MEGLSAVTWVILGVWQIVQKDVDPQIRICILCFGVEFIQMLKTKPF